MKPNNKHTTIMLLLILTFLSFCCTKDSVQINNDKKPVYIQVEAVSASGAVTYSYVVLVK